MGTAQVLCDLAFLPSRVLSCVFPGERSRGTGSGHARWVSIHVPGGVAVRLCASLSVVSGEGFWGSRRLGVVSTGQGLYWGPKGSQDTPNCRGHFCSLVLFWQCPPEGALGAIDRSTLHYSFRQSRGWAYGLSRELGRFRACGHISPTAS